MKTFSQRIVSSNKSHIVCGKFLAVFLLLLLIGAAGFSSLSAATNKQVLSQSDFRYVGGFLLPINLSNSGDTPWGKGLAYRYVNGELRLFSSGWNPQNVYEVRVPTPSAGSSLPTAALVREWGDIFGGKKSSQSGGSTLYGLYWDDTDQRLYWTFMNEYNAQVADDESVGYSVLNDTTGKAAAYGPWKFTGRGGKMTNTCVMAIPQWFADAYTGGKRLGVGCGGYQSIITVGPASLGPALAAATPPNPSTNPERSSLSYTNLIGYPFSNNPVDCTKRATRDTDYIDDFDGCNPVNGVGRWNWSDQMMQSGVWIDTASKSGVVFFPTMSKGRAWYETSTLHAQNATHWWFVYDPADLAQVAQGQKQQYSIQPKYSWAVQYSGLSYPLPGWADGPGNQITGSTYDPVGKRLYIAVRFAGGNRHIVYVYEVLDSSGGDTTPPAAPQRLGVR